MTPFAPTADLLRQVGLDICSSSTPRRTRRILARGWELHLALRCIQTVGGDERLRRQLTWLRNSHDPARFRRSLLKRAKASATWWALRLNYGTGRSFPMPPVLPPRYRAANA